MIKIAITIAIVVGLMLLWTGVQTLWKHTFSEYMADEDAMAGRTKCANCNCTTACKNKND